MFKALIEKTYKDLKARKRANAFLSFYNRCLFLLPTLIACIAFFVVATQVGGPLFLIPTLAHVQCLAKVWINLVDVLENVFYFYSAAVVLVIVGVTVSAKTSHVRTKTEIHFIGPAYSYTQ